MRKRNNRLALLSSIALMGVLFALNPSKKEDISEFKSDESTKERIGVISQEKVSADELNFPNSRYIDNQSIYKFLINSKLPFCKIDDEYYTLNGNKILFYMAKEYAFPIEMVVTDENGNKTTYLEPPEGYTLVGNQAIKYVERATILPDDMLINLQQANEILVINIVDSKPYSSLLEENLSLNLIKR